MGSQKSIIELINDIHPKVLFSTIGVADPEVPFLAKPYEGIS